MQNRNIYEIRQPTIIDVTKVTGNLSAEMLTFRICYRCKKSNSKFSSRVVKSNSISEQTALEHICGKQTSNVNWDDAKSRSI
jgi:hypothetical protein